MTDPEKDAKDSEGKKTTNQIKATIGAWWKSITVPVEETKPDKVESSAQKSSSSKSRAPESTQKPGVTADQQKADSSAVIAPAGKPTQPVSQQQTGVKPDLSDTVKTGDTEQPDKAAQPEQADSATPPKKGRRGRGRRGGRKKQPSQTQTTQESEQADSRQPKKAGQTAALRSKQEGKKSVDLVTDSESEQDISADSNSKSIFKLLINAEEPEECRLALLENGRLESIHVSTISRIQTRNNIYKARVVAIEANLQAAFVDYGTEKNGFLPFSEIHPEYYRQDVTDKVRKLVDTHQWKKLSISDVMERGQEMLVQVVKEEIGKKGANMTTYLSLPGRCLVLMPGSDSEGISRKITGEERRNRLREIMNSFQIPEGIGWIARTASVDITKTSLSKDVKFLLKLWEEIKSKGQHLEGVGLLYQDYNCVMRFLREHFDPCIQEILVDDIAALEKVENFVEMLPAKQRNVKVKQHRGARPIFNQYSVEDQIESIYQPQVSLPSGGSIVIEPTEALVAVDVNSGSTSKGESFEETIFQTNMEAAAELARQLRLRDLGGLIVVDFIDMRNAKHVREVERQIKTAMKRDKAKVGLSRISRFGLMQISRQKLGSPIESSNYHICENCKGRGTVKSIETQALFYLRRIHTGASRRHITGVSCHFPLEIARYLLNNKRQDLVELEEKYQTKVEIIADPALKPAEHEIIFHKLEKEESAKKQA